MAASFPAAQKTFTDIVDGTNFLEATQMNQAYDEIEALEGLVGPTGTALTHNDSITSVLRNYRRGCRLIPDTAAQVTVEAGEVVCQDSSGNRKFRRNTSGTTVTWADIDTGSEASDTLYYVHAVADSAASTFTCVISTSPTAPTGVTTFALLGSFYNNASSDIEDVSDDLDHVVQDVMEQDGAVATTTTTIPIDDTIPQSSEGAQFLAKSITPKHASNRLIIEVILHVGFTTSFNTATGALFKDSDTDALASCKLERTQNALGMKPLVLRYSRTAGGTSRIAFKFRAGPDVSTTMTVNGKSGSREHGGVLYSNIRIIEYGNI